MTNAISVKDRLKKQAIEDGKTMQDKLVTYGLERTIYRLSVSKYAERFTLKGGIFLYALFGGEYARATMDIDLLAQCISNDAKEMKKALLKVEFEETMQILKELLLPIVDSIHNNNSFEQIWSKETKSWL